MIEILVAREEEIPKDQKCKLVGILSICNIDTTEFQIVQQQEEIWGQEYMFPNTYCLQRNGLQLKCIDMKDYNLVIFILRVEVPQSHFLGFSLS